MDDRGCPADPVFPGLTKENVTGALIGRFEAFKFSDSKKNLLHYSQTIDSERNTFISERLSK
jgi:hypothetical protein